MVEQTGSGALGETECTITHRLLMPLTHRPSPRCDGPEGLAGTHDAALRTLATLQRVQRLAGQLNALVFSSYDLPAQCLGDALGVPHTLSRCAGVWVAQAVVWVRGGVSGLPSVSVSQSGRTLCHSCSGCSAWLGS